MHFLAELRLFLPGTVVLRPPSVWERLKETVGLGVDRATEDRTLQQDALSLVEVLGRLMENCGVRNATWLAVDEQVIFHDRKGADDDLGALEQVIHEQAASLVRPFEALTAVFERRADDLDVLIEGRVRSSFRQGVPAITLALGGRVPSLRRARAEPHDEAKARLGAMLAERDFLASHARQFSEQIERLRQGLAALFEGTIEVDGPRAVLIRPSPHYLEALAELSLRGASLWARTEPMVGSTAPPVSDPWDRYYQDLGYAWVDLIEIDEQVFPPASAPAIATPLVVIDTRGNVVASGADEEAERHRLYTAHIAAMHDFTEPDRRHAELKGYEKAKGA